MASITEETYTNGALVHSTTRTIPDSAVNADAVIAAAQQALVVNRAFVANASPSNAQVLAQTKALSRQVNGIIRLLLNQLDGTD